MSLTSKLTTIAAAGSGGDTALFILSLYGANNLYINDITTDSSGDIIAGGSSGYSTGSALNVKVGPNGNIIFSDLTGKSLYDNFKGVSVDSSGNIYSVGTIYDGASQGYIRKVSSDNTLLWEKRIYKTGRQVVLNDCDIQTTNESRLLIGGHSTGSATALAFYYGQVNTSDGTGLLDQYEQWTYSQSCYSVCAGDVSIYNLVHYGGIAGVTSPAGQQHDFLKVQRNSIISAYGETFPFAGQSNSSIQDIAISGTDAYLAVSGNRAWFIKAASLGFGAKTVKIFNSVSYAKGVAVDSSGNAYFLAYTTGVGTSNAHIFKYDSSFNLVWSRLLKASNTTRYVTPNRIAISADGLNIYVCGRENAQTDGVYSGFIFKCPTDGSLTGTYGNFVYATSATPASASAGAAKTNASTLANGPFLTDTPTTATASFTPTSVLKKG